VHESDGRDAELELARDAALTHDASDVYRTLLRGGADAWNLGGRCKLATLERLLEHHGPDAKAIVWEHASQASDARYTAMLDVGLVSLGQLARERFGLSDTVLIGCTAYEGQVVAAPAWDGSPEAMRMPHARYGSWEALLHDAGAEDKLLVFPEPGGRLKTPESLLQPRGHRTIGLVYEPAVEHIGNYMPTVLPGAYDALLYFDVAKALHPLFTQPEQAGAGGILPRR
jgi:erythromycin esterase-like protein